jgi:hypothetical protein
VCGYAFSVEALGYDPDQRCFLLRRVAEADGPPPLLLHGEDGDWQTASALREDGSSRRGLLRRRRPDTWWEWNGTEYVRVDR